MKGLKGLLVVLLAVCLARFVPSVHALDEPTGIYYEFNQTSYATSDTIEMTFYVLNYTDLYGIQIDIAYDVNHFIITNQSSPFTIPTSSLFSQDTIWINQYDDGVATLILTRPINESAGYTGDEVVVASITLTATSSLTAMYDLFTVSDDYNDLLFGDANLIMKLSDSHADPIPYTFIQKEDIPMISLNPGIDTLQVGQPHSDAGVTVTYRESYTLSITNHVDITTSGTYEIIYTVTTEHGVYMAKRMVHVIDQIPIISFELNVMVTTYVKRAQITDTGCKAYVNGIENPCYTLENNVNAYATGVYTIVYATDYQARVYTIKRYVIIIDNPNTTPVYYHKEEEWI